jgi:sugar phosphate isomerase/epimerase
MNPLAIEAQVLRELGPHEIVHAAARAGFDMAGIWIDPAIWNAARTRQIRKAFDATGVAPLDAEVIRISGGEAEEDQLKLIDIAGEIGVSHVIAVSLTPDKAATAASLAALAEYAAMAGTGIVLEFAPFSAVASAEAALEIVSAAGPSIGILPDPIHLSRSGGQPSDLLKLPPERIRFAQICDAGPAPARARPEDLLWEARFHRRPLGEGILPLADYVAALPPGIPISDETRSLQVEADYRDPVERAKAVADRLRRCMNVWTGRQ